MDLTVAVPAYNEYRFLPETVEDILKVLKEEDIEFEVIISEGGSDDGTSDRAERLQEKYDAVSYLDLGRRRGKGKAIEKAFQDSGGDYFVFMDADGATAPDQLPEMVEKLENHDLVTGTRKEQAERDSNRELASKAFNYSVRLLFSTGLSDHQCGFKGFRRKPARELFEAVESQHWFWDTELLVKARKKGLDIGVLDIEWEEKESSKVNVFQDGIYFSWKLAELRLNQWRG